MSSDAVEEFTRLMPRYPRAAAGLLEDLCARLATLDHRNHGDEDRMQEVIAEIRECFRPLDAIYPPSDDAWDQTTLIFARWLNGPSPFLRDAVVRITGWPDARIQELKENYRSWLRRQCEDYAAALSLLDGRNT